MTMPTYGLDFETYYDDTYSLSKMSAWTYVFHERFDAYLVAVCDDEFEWVGHPSQCDWARVVNRMAVVHNASFEKLVCLRLVKDGVIPARCMPVEFFDTADMSAYLRGGRALKDAVPNLLGVEISKAVRTNMKGKTYKDAVAAGMEDALLKYGADDARHSYRLFKQHASRWPECEQKLSRLNRDACIYGVNVDQPGLQSDERKLKQLLYEHELNIPWLNEENPDDNKPPLSPHAIRAYGRKHDIPVPASLAKDDPVVDKWYRKYAPKHPCLKAVREWRGVNTHLGRVLGMLGNVREDGSMYFANKYCGSHCVTEEHDVLTRDGWVPIEQWGGGDIVQWEPETKEVEFLPATPFSDTYEGPLATIDAPFVQISMTLGHTVPTYGNGNPPNRYKFTATPADQAYGRPQLAIPVAGTVPDVQPDVQGRVLAMVQADGHWVPIKDGGGLQIFLKKPRKIINARALLTQCDIPFRELVFPSHPGFVRICVRAKDCPPWLNRKRKEFGPWCLALPKNVQLGILDECSRWDGWTSSERDTREYYSMLKHNAEIVQILAHMFGVKTKLRQRKNQGYVLYLSARKTGRAWAMRKHWRMEPAKLRTVYCPRTKTGFWMVRRNNVISITGNTGRQSGGSDIGAGGRMNINNPPKSALYGVDIRRRIRPRKGMIFVIKDYGQIEARALLWRAGDERYMERMRNGENIYQIYACNTGKWSNEQGKLKDKNRALYDHCKVCVLSGGYGIGPKMFKLRAWNDYGMDIPLDEAAQAVHEYRAAHPKVVQFWRGHDVVFRWSCSHRDPVHELALASGRDLVYYDPLLDGREAKARVQMNGAHYKFYGGKLTENECQAMCRDILRDAWLGLADTLARRKDGSAVLWTLYDEFIMEVPESKAESMLEELDHIACNSSPWAEGLPLETDTKIADTYTK